MALDVVTADGELIRVDEKQNSDLFFAARGAGPGEIFSLYFLMVHIGN